MSPGAGSFSTGDVLADRSLIGETVSLDFNAMRSREPFSGAKSLVWDLCRVASRHYRSYETHLASCRNTRRGTGPEYITMLPYARCEKRLRHIVAAGRFFFFSGTFGGADKRKKKRMGAEECTKVSLFDGVCSFM